MDDVPDRRGVLVEVLRVGVDSTDKEINDAEYGAAPEGQDFLVTGHQSFGRVLEARPTSEVSDPATTWWLPSDNPGTSYRGEWSCLIRDLGNRPHRMLL